MLQRVVYRWIWGTGPSVTPGSAALFARPWVVRGVRRTRSLQLLRHNFAVLAFAKHFLSLDTGATTPEEDYLFHFLGAGQGRRVLALARGEARDTLSVKPVEAPLAPLEPPAPELAEGDPRMALRKATALVPALPPVAADPVLGPPITREPRSPDMRLRIRGEVDSSAVGGRITTIQSKAGLPSMRPLDLRSTVIPPFSFDPPPVSAEWGLPADSPTVTGNLGMFYRDGKGQTQPYTWAEFMDNLARRVRADQQPALVRAKYGVGFSLNGGDVPARAFNPEAVSEAAEFRHRHGRILQVPEALVTGPLSRDETEHYKQRLGALVSQGDDEPTDTLPPEALSALHHLGLLRECVQDVSTTHPEVRRALNAFRERVGKADPDDPAHSNRLMPAERIALEIYDRRISHYAALQACQDASSGDAPNLGRIRKLSVGLQRPTAPHIAAVQNALAAQGLLKPRIEKRVWRDKKRKKHVAYRPAPFAGKPDKATVAALDTFQLRNGLRRTDGVLDAVTLELLGLPPMGPEIFLPLTGPQCPIPGGAETVSQCEIPTKGQRSHVADLIPTRSRPAPRLLDLTSCPDCSRPPGGAS